MLFVFLLLILEAGVTADVFLNRNWEEVLFSYFYLMTYVVNGL
jgi:cytochrome c oxidase subunit IV